MPTLIDIPTAFDVAAVRADFPALRQTVNGHPLVYLDNAATSQKPQAVIDRLVAYYTQENSNVHRGVHTLSQQATDAYEAARETVARHINAPDPRQIVWTRGCTEGINLVAATFGRQRVQAGDEVVISALEHHSNIVPWQLLCDDVGATLRVIPVTDAGELDLDAYRDLLTERTKLVAVVHVSNALGTINPVEQMVAEAHARGIPVLVDGAQALPHLRVDVQALDADFYAFSGHKVFGPTGIGALYGKAEHLGAMPPYQGGGDMIDRVTFERTTFNEIPHRFEAGTPHIAGAMGLAAALDYLGDLDLDAVAAYEHDLLAYATEQAQTIDGLRLVGTAREKASVLSFVIDGVHPYDAGMLLDQRGIAIRTGHHCTQPLMDRLGLEGTMRASFAFYNTTDDVDRLIDGLHAVREQMQREVQVAAPEAALATFRERADALADEFGFFDDLDQRREYLMDLGAALPELDAAYKTETYRIHGCLSHVWLRADLEDELVRFRADSNAMITKGLIALLIRLLDGLPPDAIVQADVEGALDRIEMPRLISSQRKNGLAAMIRQIQRYALAFTTTQA